MFGFYLVLFTAAMTLETNPWQLWRLELDFGFACWALTRFANQARRNFQSRFTRFARDDNWGCYVHEVLRVKTP